MARNKRGREMAAGLKTKEDVQLAKTTGHYEVEIDNNISESSSEGETPAKKTGRVLHRIAKAIRRAARKRQMMNKKGATSVEVPDKKYKVLVQYHPLNYTAIKAAIEENNLQCIVVEKDHLWMDGVDSETLAIARKALLACHFRTKQGKEYKVRFAAYRSTLQVVKKNKQKKSTNNKPEVALAAKKQRKKNNLEKALKYVGHKQHRAAAGSLRSQRKHNHKPAVLNTSSIAKKLHERVKKAIAASERAERDRAAQAKSRANKGIPQPKKGKQLEIAA